jgi:hypothetical protein
MRSWPNVYSFGDPIGRVDTWFAWRPVRLWWGKWVWLRTVHRARICKHTYLHGPDWQFWSYEAALTHGEPT